jgi:acyl carrier protein
VAIVDLPEADSLAARRVAVVVPRDFASAPEIREFAWETLGDEEAPDGVLLVRQLPIAADGAVDLLALRRWIDEEPDSLSVYLPPTTSTENELAVLFAELLGKRRVGVNDDFLEQGGNSSIAIEAINLIEERLGVRLGLEEFFDGGRIRTLAVLTDQKRQADPKADDKS